jgi:hypothetical protein
MNVGKYNERIKIIKYIDGKLFLTKKKIKLKEGKKNKFAIFFNELSFIVSLANKELYKTLEGNPLIKDSNSIEQLLALILKIG